MDKRTLLAITLSTAILMIWFGVQARNNSAEQAALVEEELSSNALPSATTNSVSPAPLTNADATSTDAAATDQTQNHPLRTISISTDIYDIIFSSKNGTIQSLILTNDISQEADEDVEIVPKGELDKAFRIIWGDADQDAIGSDVYYRVYQPSKYVVEFSREFLSASGVPFAVKKIYEVKEGEHIVDLKVVITNSENALLNLGEDYAYSLLFGPQLGPYGEIVDTQKSKQLSRRRLVVKEQKKVRNVSLKPNRSIEKTNFYKWVGISGRYISMLILTGSTSFVTQFSTFDEPGLNSGAQVLLRRPRISSSAVEDRYRIYFGPNTRGILGRYNKAENNAFGIQDADFKEIKPSRILGVLEYPIHKLMQFLYALIPNYGIVIILLTLLVRLLTLPVIKKSKANGEKMKALGPKMQIIKTKFASDPVKMNQEVMALYKKEQVSPMSSLVPMLIQLPFFLAMYRVIYESVELWQAPFFSWISDLSSPDEIISFGDFTVPVLGWNSLHLLPIIMLATQYISSFIMMSQQDHSSGSPKMIFIMSYVFPFMIFFALYNSPSGLIVYWIFSNLFTVVTMMDWKKKKAPTPVLVSKPKSKIIKQK